MNLEIKVLKIQDLEALYEFEKSQNKNLNDIEKTLLEWKAPWRKESLEHYLNTSWCMGCYHPETKELVGYFLAQPMLFIESYTQTLWVEHIGYKDQSIGEEMVELLYKYARDKHLQRVLFNSLDIFKKSDKIKVKLASTQKNFYEVFTTKLG